MGEKFTQIDQDNLADIIWWIKGYIAGAKENFQECPFSMAHHESLRKGRIILDKILYTKRGHNENHKTISQI